MHFTTAMMSPTLGVNGATIWLRDAYDNDLCGIMIEKLINLHVQQYQCALSAQSQLRVTTITDAQLRTAVLMESTNIYTL